jgi:hypothetical protein
MEFSMTPFPDLVILLPGITGSVLANARGKEVWSPSAGAVWRAISSFGNSIDRTWSWPATRSTTVSPLRAWCPT